MQVERNVSSASGSTVLILLRILTFTQLTAVVDAGSYLMWRGAHDRDHINTQILNISVLVSASDKQ